MFKAWQVYFNTGDENLHGCSAKIAKHVCWRVTTDIYFGQPRRVFTARLERNLPGLERASY
jgi:hypothetical protein